jgi:hypothetical protein
MFIIYWLLVLTILKNMISSMGRIIPYNYYGKKCLKPPASISGMWGYGWLWDS